MPDRVARSAQIRYGIFRPFAEAALRLESVVSDAPLSTAEALAHLALPREPRRGPRASNLPERLMRERRGRARVVGAFPDGESAVLLVGARRRHVAGSKWGGRRYPDMGHWRQWHGGQLERGEGSAAAGSEVPGQPGGDSQGRGRAAAWTGQRGPSGGPLIQKGESSLALPDSRHAHLFLFFPPPLLLQHQERQRQQRQGRVVAPAQPAARLIQTLGKAVRCVQ